MKINVVGANQIELELNDGTIVLFSYQTPVAYKKGDKTYITAQKWSRTTRKHVSRWAHGTVVRCVPQFVLDNLVA